MLRSFQGLRQGEALSSSRHEISQFERRFVKGKVAEHAGHVLLELGHGVAKGVFMYFITVRLVYATGTEPCQDVRVKRTVPPLVDLVRHVDRFSGFQRLEEFFQAVDGVGALERRELPVAADAASFGIRVENEVKHFQRKVELVHFQKLVRESHGHIEGHFPVVDGMRAVELVARVRIEGYSNVEWRYPSVVFGQLRRDGIAEEGEECIHAVRVVTVLSSACPYAPF